MDAPPLIEKYSGPIATLLVALFGAGSAWVAKISGRVTKVESLAAANKADIRYGAANVAKLEDTVRRNHAENMRMHERVYDRVDQIARRDK